mgnify:CR=1 FL=1
MQTKLLFITPPFTQLNTAYPASAYLKGFFDALTSVFPSFGDLAKTGEINSSGFTSGFGAGYRYVVQVGYRF